jgi:tape measure domain-containing protein
MHQQRLQQSATMHQQRLYNTQQTNQRAADAAQQRSQQSAATHQNTLANQNKLNAQRVANLQSKGLADIQWITNKINNDNALAASKQLTEAQRLSNLQTSANIAMAKGRVQVNNLMQQTLVIQRRLNNLQDDNHRKAIKHNEQMKKSAQALADMQRKANQDAQTHVLRTQALQQKMQIDREIHAKRMASRYYTTHPTKFSYTAPTRTSGSGVMGGSGLGGGLTSRADIYMHTNAIRNTIELARGLVNLRIQYRENEVAIEAFAGSSEKAAAAMKAIQQFAEVSPYSTLELAQAARNMMSFGVSTDETIKVMRHLGEVAGGSQFRLDRLAFAMSQIVSTGKLVGNDLRQLTEQGFNPLKTISDKTKISIETLNKAKENGLITSEDVISALKMETTGAGRFAGVLRKVSAEMGGLMNQAKEGMRNTAMEFIKILEPSINQSLKRLLMFIEAFRGFMKDNPERVVQIANLAKNIFALKIGFHLLGLSVASVRWSTASLLATFKGLRLLALPVTASMAMLSLILGSIASTIAAIATGSILGVVASIAGMVKALAGLAAVGMGIALLRDYIAGKGGLKEAFRAMVIDISILNERMKGFFANIKENLGILDNWFRTNFDAILGVVSSVANSMLSALIDNMMLVGKSLIAAFAIAFDWLLANLPMIIGKFKEAWKKSDTAKSASNYAGLFVMSQAAAFLDMLATGGPLVPDALRKGSPFKDMLANAVSKSPKFMGGGGNRADASNKAFSDGMLGVGQKLLAGLKSGFEKVDLKGLALPGLNLKVAEKLVKEPALPEELQKFETDFKELMQRIEEMMKEPEKKLKTGAASAYSVADAMNFNSAQYAAASYESLRRLRDFQAGQKSEKNPAIQEQITTNRHLEKLIELQRKSGPKLEVIGVMK